MIHLGHGDLMDEDVVDRCVTLIESTSPSSLLTGSLDAARRLAAVRGRELLARDDPGAGRRPRRRCGRCPGSTCSTSAWPAPRACSPTTRCGWRSTSAAPAHSGYELARLVRERDDVNLELAGENVMVAVFGMGEDATAGAARLVAALRHVVETLSESPRTAGTRRSRRRRPGGSSR